MMSHPPTPTGGRTETGEPEGSGGMQVPFGRAAMERSLVDRFEQQVAVHSGRLAVKTGTLSMSYDALNRAANRLARAILARQGSTEVPVAFVLGHGASALVAILGVLKTGRFYLALDPRQPEARLIGLLEDSGADLVVTEGEHLGLARSLASAGALQGTVPVLDLDELDPSLASGNLGLSISPDANAFLYYTSGTTGKPKGMVRTHRHQVHSIWRNAECSGFCPDDRHVLLASFSYGASSTPIYNSLLNGGSVFPYDLKEQGLAGLARWLIEEQITVYHSVATTFRHLAWSLTGEERFLHLRLVRLGGETIQRQDVELFQRLFSPDCVLCVGLATSETSTICWHLIHKDTEITGSNVPAGYPVEDTEVWLLDEDGNQVGLGQVGEIAVRSRYLVPGYWRRPELTRTKFLPDPQGGNQRIYLTGDLGRMRPDGMLEHLGRKDLQVKVRGHRIEISEIELALLEMEGIREAAVAAPELPSGDRRLVAYLVPATQPPPTVAELRQALARQLPDHMIPSAFAFMPEGLPLTAAGKVDRRALPPVDEVALDGRGPTAEARDEVERRLVQMWGEVLGLRSVGIRDDFFELGGHSILAMRLFVGIEREFGRRLPVSVLLEAPTVELLAQVLDQAEDTVAAPTLVPIQPGGSRPPFFFVHGYGGGILGYAELARRLGPDQPSYGLQARGLDGLEEPHRRIEEMAAHYVEVMRTVQPAGPYYLGGYCFGGWVAFEMALQLEARGAPVGLLALLEGDARLGSDVRPRQRQPGTWFRFVGNFPFWFWDMVRRPGLVPRLLSLLAGGKRSDRTNAISEWDAPDLQRAVGRIAGDTRHLSESERRLMAAHSQAARHYRPGVYSGPVTLFRVRALALRRTGDPAKGWGRLAAGGVEIKMVPGAHYNMLEKPHVEGLAAALRASLAAAQAVLPTPAECSDA